MRDRLSQVEFEEREGVLIARVSGEVDGSNTVELGRALGEKLPSSAHGLVLDLSGIAYLDSAGIELLFSLARRLGDRRQRLRLSVPQAVARAQGAGDLRHRQRRADGGDGGRRRRADRRRRRLGVGRSQL